MAAATPTPGWMKRYAPNLANIASFAQGTNVADLTDNTNGTAGSALAAGVGFSQACFQVDLARITTNQDVITNFVLGCAFELVALDFVVNAPVTTAGKTTTLHLEIGTTAVGAGTLALTSAACTPMGKLVAGAAITSAATGSASDTVSVVSASTTAHTEGSGTLIITYINLDDANAIASLNAKLSAVLSSLETANVMASS